MTVYEALGQAIVGIAIILLCVAAWMATVVGIMYLVAHLGGSGPVAVAAVVAWTLALYVAIITAVVYLGA